MKCLSLTLGHRVPGLLGGSSGVPVQREAPSWAFLLLPGCLVVESAQSPTLPLTGRASVGCRLLSAQASSPAGWLVRAGGCSAPRAQQVVPVFWGKTAEMCLISGGTQSHPAGSPSAAGTSVPWVGRDSGPGPEQVLHGGGGPSPALSGL